MIVCHCTHITDHQIHEAIAWIRASDPQAMVTPGRIYAVLGKRADCGGCMALFVSTMRKSRDLELPPAGEPQVPVRLKGRAV